MATRPVCMGLPLMYITAITKNGATSHVHHYYVQEYILYSYIVAFRQTDVVEALKRSSISWKRGCIREVAVNIVASGACMYAGELFHSAASKHDPPSGVRGAAAPLHGAVRAPRERRAAAGAGHAAVARRAVHSAAGPESQLQAVYRNVGS